MSNVMDVKDDGGWRSRASGILGFFACFVTLIPLLRSILGLKMPTGTRIPIELTYYKYGLLLGVGGTIAALAWGKGFGGWRLTGLIMSAFGIVLAVSFLMLNTFTDSFNNQ